jgi:exodeoxyribonuclease VII small subunit
MKPISPTSKQPIEQSTYEEAFSELEQIVAQLESNSLDLEVSLALFERGQALANHCATLLDKAEFKVQQITGNGQSDFVPES